MNHIKVVVSREFHFHGFEMSAAIAKAVKYGGEPPTRLEASHE